MLTGAYINLHDLLALRFSRANRGSRKRQQRMTGHRAGAKLSNIKGRGVDLAEVRIYQPGDDVRSMDWRVTARTNKPHTKVFREERERPALLVIDQSQSMFFGSQVRLKSVAAAELGARVAWQTLSNGDRIGGIVVGNQATYIHKPYRSNRSVARLLGDVARSNQSLTRETRPANPADEDYLWQVRRLARSNFRVVIISDFMGDLTQWQDHLHHLARSNQVAVMHISDPIEAELPPADHYQVTHQGSRMAFYSGHTNTRERYRAQFERRSEAIEKMCQHENMQYLHISTTTPQKDIALI